MHFTDKQYLKTIFTKFLDMHDLSVNINKFHQITKKYLSGALNKQGNVQSYRNPPSFSDSSIIALAVCQEALGIDSELWFHTKIKTDYSKHFANLPHITRYNYRRKRLAPWIQQLNEAIAHEMNEGEDFLSWTPCLFRYVKMPERKDLSLAVRFLKLLLIRDIQP